MSKLPQPSLDHFLRSFLRIAQVGSLHKAAPLLGVSQPALSKQMSSLEKSLGIELLRRTTRGVSLTSQGEQLVSQLQASFEGIDAAVQNAKGQSKTLRGQIAFGAIETSSVVDQIWDLIASISAANPQLSINIRTFFSAEIIRRVAVGELDFGIVHDNAEFPSDIKTTQLLTERLSVVFSPAHFSEEVVSQYPRLPKDIQLISFDATSALGRLVRDHARSHDIGIRLETNSVQYLLAAVSKGIGIALLPEFFPIDSFGKNEFRRLLPPALGTTRATVIIQRRRGTLSPQSQEFLKRLMAISPQFRVKDAGSPRRAANAEQRTVRRT